MFQQFKNIDTAFRFVRGFSIVFLLATASICIYMVYRTTAALQKAQDRIYVLYHGKLIEAQAIERKDSLAVEIRDHVKMFHFYFYSLQPDDEVNTRHINDALYLADSSAYREYRSLMDIGYYSQFITSNANQEVLDYDSISVDVTHTPYFFRYYGRLRVTRPSAVAIRSLITEGYIRLLNTVSDKNPHGFLIEHWKVDDNRDLSVEKR